MKIIVVNGLPESGKTTFEKIIKKKLGRDCDIFSTIDPVKSKALEWGWDGMKTPENRKYLKWLKEIMTAWGDQIFEALRNNIFKNSILNTKLLFVDCREPKEIKRICDWFDAKSLLIRRAGHEIQASNESDSADNIYNYNYDYVIDNDGDLAQLEEKAIKFLEEIKIPVD